MKKTKVAIVDDEELLVSAIKNVLNRNKRIKVIFTANDGTDLFNKITVGKIVPDIVIMDLSMPIMDGISANKLLNQLYPQVKVIIMTLYSDDELFSRIIKNNIRGYLSKNIDVKTIVDAIETVDSGQYYLNIDDISRVAKLPKNDIFLKTIINNNSYEFTKREKEVLYLSCKAKTATEISLELDLSRRTVEWHRDNILTKTNTKSIVEVVVLFIQKSINRESVYSDAW